TDNGAEAARGSVGCPGIRPARAWSCRGLSGLVRLRLPAASALLAATRRHLLENLHLAKPNSCGLCRDTSPARARRHVVVDDAGCGYLRPVADTNVIVDAHARSQHDEVADGDASRDAGLRHHDAMTPDDDIEADLDQVVDFSAFADDRVAIGAPIDGRT